MVSHLSGSTPPLIASSVVCPRVIATAVPTMMRVAPILVLIVTFLCAAARGASVSDNEDSAVRKRRQQLVYNVADGSSAAMNNKVRGYTRLSQQHRDLFSGEDEKVFLNRLLFDSQDSVKSAKATPKPTRT